MSAIAPPTITPLPPFPSTDDPDNFDVEADAFVAAEQPWGEQVAAVGQNAYLNAVDAAASATAAAGAVVAASNFADAAHDSAIASAVSAANSSDSADNASDFAAASAASAAASASSVAAMMATSTTSLVIGVGTKVFTTQANKQFGPNQTLKAVNPTNAAQYMIGTATYSGTTLTLAVTDVNPATSGNVVANWSIVPSGEKGATGATGGVAGGNLTGALNERRADDVPTSATPDIWSGAGNFVRLVGDGTVINFTTAPQNGASRTVLAVGNITFQNGANLVPYGGTFSVVAGDLLEVVAENTGRCRVVLNRENGTPAIGSKMYMEVLTSGSTWTVQASSFEVEVQAGGQGGYNEQTGDRGGGAAGWCAVKRFQGATIGATALLSFGGAGAPGTAATPPATGGTSSFALSGFATVSATFNGASGADLIYPPRPRSNVAKGQGGDSRNGFGGPMTNAGGANAVGYGAGGSGGAGSGGAETGGLGTAGVIIIRYFK